MITKDLKKQQYAPLEKEFKGKGEVKGYYFTQILATDKGYIYKKQYNDKITYEVFKKKINRRFNKVSYPSSNNFGIWAFDVTTYEKALQRLNEF